MHFAKSGKAPHRAAVFVDYENLFSHLYGRTGARMKPDALISELLQALKRYLMEQLRTSTVMAAAYADFSEMQGGGQQVQRGLYLHGVEPRFVPASMQRNAAEIQLTVDAVETLYTRNDVTTLAIVSGDRHYLPLVQHCLRNGSRALVLTFKRPETAGSHVDEDLFLNAHTLLSESSRRTVAAPQAAHRAAPAERPEQAASRSENVEYRSLTHEGALRALEIIDQHFGHYNEIYLTPCLRKLSEVLDDSEYDPKSLISEIENAGAVWLEKRRGFPYDYTVLLIDAEHPDVVAIREDAYPAERADDYGNAYTAENDGEYDEEEYESYRGGYREQEYDEDGPGNRAEGDNMRF